MIKKTHEELIKIREGLVGNTWDEITRIEEFYKTKLSQYYNEFKKFEIALKEKPNPIVVYANYQGRLNYGKYQFSFLGNIKYSDENIGFLIPQSGHIRKIILRTPYDFDKTPGLYRFDDYVEITQSFLTVVKKKKKHRRRN